MKFRGLILLLMLFSLSGLAVAQDPSSLTGALVVWVAEGPSPDGKTANSPSQVAAVLPDGTLTTLLELDPSTISVTRCTSLPFSPDGRHFVFFASQPAASVDGGTLYQMTDFGAPVIVGTLNKLGCALSGFAYSPNSMNLAYIDYQQIVDTSEFSTGTLIVRDVETLTEQTSFANVGTFVWHDDDLLFMQYFTTGTGQVDEIAVNVWDGSALREVGTLVADSGCRFTGGEVAPASENRIVVLTGQRCRSVDGTRANFYVINADQRTVTLAQTINHGGGYFPNTQTYNLLPFADGNQIMLTTPDGLSRDTAGVGRMDMTALGAPIPIISRGAVMRRYIPQRYTLPEFASALRSPDGRYWAAAVVDPNGAELVVLDFALPEDPIRIPISSSGDAVRAMGFNADSQSLYYVVGGRGGQDNALFRLDLETGSESRIVRGQFATSAAFQADGTAALLQYRQTADTTPRTYVDLVRVSPDGAVVPLMGGVVLDDQGFFQNFRFIIPLAWR